MHHSISDGVSMAVLFMELADLYEGTVLPGLRVQYKDFSEWQNKIFETDALKEQERYWMKQFEDGVPALDLPLDFKRPEIRTYEGRTIQFTLSKKSSVSFLLFISSFLAAWIAK